ncbi:MAG: hypothetical protein HQK98_02730 [Nitrospirae bacterium]|nr:hypothetical protein [Nitrospirota bacterium]
MLRYGLSMYIEWFTGNDNATIPGNSARGSYLEPDVAIIKIDRKGDTVSG